MFIGSCLRAYHLFLLLKAFFLNVSFKESILKYFRFLGCLHTQKYVNEVLYLTIQSKSGTIRLVLSKLIRKPNLKKIMFLALKVYLLAESVCWNEGLKIQTEIEWFHQKQWRSITQPGHKQWVWSACGFGGYGCPYFKARMFFEISIK